MVKSIFEGPLIFEVDLLETSLLKSLFFVPAEDGRVGKERPIFVDLCPGLVWQFLLHLLDKIKSFLHIYYLTEWTNSANI